MIAQKTVDQIFETVKIEDIIQDFVNLRKRGVNMLGLCPFHNEKTPSFTVSPAKNIYKCFGCGKAGNSVQFIMEHEHFTFPEALKYLAAKYGIKVEETAVSQEVIQERQKKDSLYLVNEYAKEFWQKQLLETDRGKSIGLSYFKSRGYRRETIKKFGLGYAPAKKDAFTLQAINTGYNIELLRQLGLTSKYDNDFFRDRVMFSIHNLSGKAIAFAGRILVKNVKAPKYMNSPETEIYTKSKVLYGAYFAKKHIQKEDECILVEGYTDVISLHQAGVENVVASSGTSLTVGQIALVRRYTPNIKILYDGDPAGIKAALRGLDLVLEQNMNVKVVLLPDGEDPDSYLQKVGVTVFKEFLKSHAEDFILFKTNLLLKETEGDPVKRSYIIKDIVSSIAKIPDTIKRSLYIRECARQVDIEETILVTEMNKLIRVDIKNKRNRAQLDAAQKARRAGIPKPNDRPNFPPRDRPDSGFPDSEFPSDVPMITVPSKKKQVVGNEFQEKHIVQILVTSGGEMYDAAENMTIAEYILGNIQELLDDFDNESYAVIAKECVQMLLDKRPISTQHFINHVDPKISALAIDLITSPFEYSANWVDKWDIPLSTQPMPEFNFTEDSVQSLMRFKLKKVVKMWEANQAKIKELIQAKDRDQMMVYLKVQQQLTEVRNDLAKKWGTVILG